MANFTAAPVKATMSIQTVRGSDNSTKSFGNINLDYYKMWNVSATTPDPEQPADSKPAPYDAEGDAYENVADWAEQVARAICSLSNRVYMNSYVYATWDIGTALNY